MHVRWQRICPRRLTSGGFNETHSRIYTRPPVLVDLIVRMLLLGQRDLERVLEEYVEHYNTHRAHRALNLRAPADAQNVIPPSAPRIARRAVLRGLINEYEASARPRHSPA
jgi:transposase InsO family protein